MTEILHLEGLEFEVRRSERRQTLGLTVDRSGALIAHAPSETSIDELSQWIQRKLLWMYRKLAAKEEAMGRMRVPEYVSGETFCYLGRRYRLKIVDRQEQALQFDGACFTLRQDARPAETHFRSWYISTGADWLRGRARTLSARSAGKPMRVDVRNLGFRWGSCGKNGVLYLNWKLLQLPVRLIDYVIVHELTHLCEPRHGKEFQEALFRTMPSWQERKKELARLAKDYLLFGLVPREVNASIPTSVQNRKVPKG